MGRKLEPGSEPEPGIPFADTHCHVPWTEGKPHPSLPVADKQVADFGAAGGSFLITCSIDLESTIACLEFSRRHDTVHFSCGMAAQTVTYTDATRYRKEYEQWTGLVEKNLDHIIAFGEIGLDFHHAKTLKKREEQVSELERILAFIKPFNKPTVLHVRNAGPGDVDKKDKTHPYNAPDAATKTIVEILDRNGFDPSRVLFHCYSGPVSMNEELVRAGFWFSVPSSAFGFNRWAKVSKTLPLDRLVTETDAPFQHPTKMGPVNVPANARFSVAAIARARGINEHEVGRATVENAKGFFGIRI